MIEPNQRPKSPCPHCGSWNLRIGGPIFSIGNEFVECMKCRATAPLLIWNNRKRDDREVRSLYARKHISQMQMESTRKDWDRFVSHLKKDICVQMGLMLADYVDLVEIPAENFETAYQMHVDVLLPRDRLKAKELEREGG